MRRIDCWKHPDFCTNVERAGTAILEAGKQAIESGMHIPFMMRNPTPESMRELIKLFAREGWELTIPVMGIGPDPRYRQPRKVLAIQSRLPRAA